MQIAGQPDAHKNLVLECCQLYSKKSKKLEAKQSEFIKNWWEASYDEYIAGNDFSECDMTSLFNIYKKYMPERSCLRENLFKKVSLESDVGKQCLYDMVALCMLTEKVAYYPGLTPIDEQCPVCSRQMAEYGSCFYYEKNLVLIFNSLAPQGHAKHILQCQRKILNAAPYQQCYKNGKQAHCCIQRSFVQFCYVCAELFYSEGDWIDHCQHHLENIQPCCGILTF